MSITLAEALRYRCDSCNKLVTPDQNMLCPDCSENLVMTAVENIISDNSEYILLFDEKGYINKKNLRIHAKGHDPVGDKALVLRVSKEFFDYITPTGHDRTSANSTYGKIIIADQPKMVQLLLKALKPHAMPYEKLKQGVLVNAQEAFEYMPSSEKIRNNEADISVIKSEEQSHKDFNKRVSVKGNTGTIYGVFTNRHGEERYRVRLDNGTELTSCNKAEIRFLRESFDKNNIDETFDDAIANRTMELSETEVSDYAAEFSLYENLWN